MIVTQHTRNEHSFIITVPMTEIGFRHIDVGIEGSYKVNIHSGNIGEYTKDSTKTYKLFTPDCTTLSFHVTTMDGAILPLENCTLILHIEMRQI
jgi:hypothetical protein